VPREIFLEEGFGLFWFGLLVEIFWSLVKFGENLAARFFGAVNSE
jgi:hypothetical protein